MTRRTRAEQLSDWQLREKRRQRLIVLAGIAAVVAFVGMLAYLVWQEAQPTPRPGEDVPLQSAGHIEIGQAHEPYNSDPPTSGPHYAQAADAGFYDEAPPDEQLVHNLEHGHVIIWYNCTGLEGEACDRLKSQIRDVMGRAGVSNITRTLKLVAVPRPAMDATIGLTSWGRLDKLEEFDRQRIVDFIRAFRESERAPEPLAE